MIGHIVFGSNNFRSPTLGGFIAMPVAWAVAYRLSVRGVGGSPLAATGCGGAGQERKLTRQIIWR
jgi:hypothetical protein